MKSHIRQMLDEKRKEIEMPEQPNTGLSPEQFQQLLQALTSKPMSPLEEKRWKEEQDKEKRRADFSKYMAQIEESGMNSKKFCTHTRDKDGNNAPRGQGTWTTQGQVHGDDTVTLICMRCCNVWHWKATAQERDLAVNGAHGLLGFAPPSDDRLIKVA